MKFLKIIVLFLFIFAFWFEGNTLRWIDSEEPDQFHNWLQFQLDKNNPPNINQEPIEFITVYDTTVNIYTKWRIWRLHYEGNPILDWYVEDSVNR